MIYNRTTDAVTPRISEPGRHGYFPSPNDSALAVGRASGFSNPAEFGWRRSRPMTINSQSD
ncbi:hypothetical protein FTUN_8902 [Frigoriglobus tundricola]|uniref:Uncharacterized protein n=1 Tax=Frigoriglobus tundricola TaxID=2774151 RepID=A0A6M5Z6M8_9BACT|nr:hypothetical protein FTUN_8902 [Frigoriglobus tundricola]